MATLIDEEFFARLRLLNDKFAASIPTMLDRLRALRLAFNPDSPAPQAVADLQQLLHTIAGSAATFGFRSFGQQARSLEQRLRVLTAFEVIPARDWCNWLDSLDEMVAWAAIDPKAAYFEGDGAK
jgi:HPt (histidine-containing phosphotransfer) domain-containing protein